MSFDVPQPSLPELFRSLRLEPGLQAGLVALAERVERSAALLEHAAEHQQMLARAAVPLPRGGRHRREHAHLRLVAVVAAIVVAGAALRAWALWAFPARYS